MATGAARTWEDWERTVCSWKDGLGGRRAVAAVLNVGSDFKPFLASGAPSKKIWYKRPAVKKDKTEFLGLEVGRAGVGAEERPAPPPPPYLLLYTGAGSGRIYKPWVEEQPPGGGTRWLNGWGGESFFTIFSFAFFEFSIAL